MLRSANVIAAIAGVGPGLAVSGGHGDGQGLARHVGQGPRLFANPAKASRQLQRGLREGVEPNSCASSSSRRRRGGRARPVRQAAEDLQVLPRRLPQRQLSKPSRHEPFTDPLHRPRHCSPSLTLAGDACPPRWRAHTPSHLTRRVRAPLPRRAPLPKDFSFFLTSQSDRTRWQPRRPGRRRRALPEAGHRRRLRAAARGTRTSARRPSTGSRPINARDRIGTGPVDERARRGHRQAIVAHLHGDTRRPRATGQQPEQGHGLHRDRRDRAPASATSPTRTT